MLGRVAGKIAAPLALLTGGYGVYSSVKDGGKADVLDAITAGAGAGGITGAIFGGVGAVPGAIIGGLLGGAGAIIYNSREAIASTYGQAKQYLGDLSDAATAYAKDKWSSATKKMGEVSDYAKEKIGEAWDSVKKTAAEYRDQVGEWLSNQGKTLREWFDGVTAGLRSAISLQSLRAMASEWLSALKNWFYNKFKIGGGSDAGSGSGDAGGGSNPSDKSYGGGPQNPTSMYAPGSGGYAGGGIAPGGRANWGTEGGVARGFQPSSFVKGGEYGYAPQGSQGSFGVGGVTGGTADVGTVGRGGFDVNGPVAGGDRMYRPDVNVPTLGKSGGSAQSAPQFWQYGARLGMPGEQTQTAAGPGVVSATNTGERSYKNRGTLVLRDPKSGEVLGSYPYVTGGGGKGSLPTGEFNIGNMMRGGSLGDRWVLTQKGQPHDTAQDPGIPGYTGPSSRSAFRIHQAHGNGTLGCIGILGGSEVYQDFKSKLMYVIGANGGKATLRIGSPEAMRVMNNMTPVPPNASRQTIDKVKADEGKGTEEPAAPTSAPKNRAVDSTKPAWQQGADSQSFSLRTDIGGGKVEPEKEKTTEPSSVKEKEPAEAPAEREDTPDASAPTSASGIKGKRVSIDDIPTVHPNVHLAMVGASDKA